MGTPGQILDLSRASSLTELTADVCVIGSGCGGATAARVLAEAGRQVVVLEEGGDFTGKQLTQREAVMYDQLYMDRGGRATEDLAVTVMQGRVLGGGGVINACDVTPLSDTVLDHWRTKHGLADFTAARLRPHTARALKDLSATRITDAELNRANLLLRRGAEALGWRGEAMMHNRVGCEELGTCLIGCPVDAKRNPRLVAIPASLKAGASYYTRARAVRIDHAGQQIKQVAVRTLDPRGYHERGQLTVRARQVIIAGNAVASAQLLLRSGVGNEHVGRHLMLQPQLPIMGIFKQKVEGFSGIPQSYAVTQFEQHQSKQHGWWGFRIEGVFGTPGIVSTLIPFTGLQAKQLMAGYAHAAGALLLAPDTPSGQVSLTSDGRPLIRYRHAAEHKARLRQAIKAAARVYLAAGASRVLVTNQPPMWIRGPRDLVAVDKLSFDPATAPLISAHQQGTVRFASSAASGAADPAGEVYGTRGVYVFDSSGFPSSAASHTMTPIMAVASLLATQLASP